MNLQAIPKELKQFRQWINWNYDVRQDGKMTKTPISPHTGCTASVTNPLLWSTFDHAVHRLDCFNGIGFVFTKSDPYCGIDLDNPESDFMIANSHGKTLELLNSYSEVSPSGLGVHIIVKAVLPDAGRRRNKVEIYDTERFFTITGDDLNFKPIADRQKEVEVLYSSLGAEIYVPTFNPGEAQVFDDATILRQASLASNGDKFTRLFAGLWQADYPSQSEADFSLINILAFYTKNKEQIVRLFLQSGLGKRDKAKRAKYIAYMVNRAFDRMPPKADLDALHNQRLSLLASLKG
jgi:primase-polymerase (primpol)-like protein